ncbi:MULTISPECIES: sulfite exporter TauE/SafE family protein [Dyella]|uniref:Sulfite exporter TauE/SafE family protein n=2 Tax=Dyella TaxID=231454 RepID=A0A4R0YU20_9GAMM|nr:MULTISPECIES: sulfite exporter TauE/SafE family protein [Dyella]TBR39646.1 sulfite exporter TauE/SafE family protein [Dyella terrae]TCI12772.1 sulfite exporter TauE/SafE family protein [Dyella soli]
MTGSLNIVAALLLGLAASGHCVLMCGGISGALALGTQRNARGKPKASLLLAYQLGRLAGYAMAGIVFGSIGAGLFLLFDQDGLRTGLRMLAALAFALAALALWRGRGWLESALGSRVWRRLAPQARRLFPVNNVARAMGIGLIWGWMPCGFVYTVLLLALASFDPWRSAATMLAFGVGTLPSMLVAAFGAGWFARWMATRTARNATAGILVLMALATLAGPWLAHWGMPHLTRWMPMDC